MWGGISLRIACDRVSGATGAFQILKRGKSLFRVPVTDVEPLRHKMKPNQSNTVVLVRRHPPRLLKKNGPTKRLLPRNYIYDVVSNNQVPLPSIEVILKDTVPGLGNVGEKVTVRGDKAYHDFILPGIAMYASPENIEKNKNKEVSSKPKFSSATAANTIKALQCMVLGINMNMHNEWTIDKWHIRVSFRKTGLIIPDECIELPEKSISGPDLDKQGKHFIVTVIINNYERVPVRCRINHWSNNPQSMLPWQPYWWLEAINPLFPEDMPKFDAFPPVRGPYPTEEEIEDYELKLSYIPSSK